MPQRHIRLPKGHLPPEEKKVEFKDIDKVRKYRKDICKASKIEFKEEYMDTDHFLGRFGGPIKDYFNSLGLINRGFCPLCGDEPIGEEYFRALLHTHGVKQYMCKSCWERTNPHITDPGYTRRYYTATVGCWVIGILIALGIIFLLKGCIQFIF